MLHRREFLKVTGMGAAAAAVSGPLRLLSQESTRAQSATRSIVCIYLRGGMDALNALVPHGDRRYYEIRPTIAIPAKEDEDGPGILPLDATFGLHPSLKALKPLWDAGRFAPVICSGSPHQTRSHFDAQDFMEYAAPGLRGITAGWLNRYLTATKARAEKEKTGDFLLRAMAMQPLLPRSLRGDFPVLAVPERRVLDNDKVLDTFDDVYGPDGPKETEMGRRAEDPVVESGRETLETLRKYKEALKRQSGAKRPDYPSGPLGSKLKDIASILQADIGLEAACVDVGGWDHHTAEGGQVGTISTMLKNLADSIASFTTDLGDRLDRTLVMVMTEFGRTCRENGNTGTDHGHGGVMFMVGGKVRGGKIHGTWNGLEDKSLYEARDLPVTTDFRDLFAEALRNHMAWDPPKGFFPDYQPGTVKGLFA